jgi:hypothetical protein
MAAAQATVAHLPSGVRVVSSQSLVNAFMEGFHRGCLVAALVAAAVAVAVFKFLPPRSSRRASALAGASLEGS